MKNLTKIREDFPIFQNHPDLVYLDSAATSQKPQVVIEAISNYYKSSNANIHRGIYKLAENATAQYEEVRNKVQKFINTKHSHEIIFTRNATESINLVAQTWGTMHADEANTILISEMEHHANIVPWQMIRGIRSSTSTEGITGIEFIKLDSNYQLDLDDLEKKLQANRVSLVAITHVSNVLGTITPIKDIIKLAHKHGALVLVDGCQAVPHFKVDVEDLDVDFYVFSSHKILGPTGIGILYGKTKLLEEMPPYQGGGEMIKKVTQDGSSWNDLPWKFEAGTPNIAGVIGLGVAIDYLEEVGLKNIAKHEQELGEYCLEKISSIEGLKLYGPPAMQDRVTAFSFTLEGMHPHDIAQVLDEYNIAVRAGHHCAMPLHEQTLKIPATTRASLYLYNTKEDIDKLIQGLEKTKKVLK